MYEPTSINYLHVYKVTANFSTKSHTFAGLQIVNTVKVTFIYDQLQKEDTELL